MLEIKSEAPADGLRVLVLCIIFKTQKWGYRNPLKAKIFTIELHGPFGNMCALIVTDMMSGMLEVYDTIVHIRNMGQ